MLLIYRRNVPEKIRLQILDIKNGTVLKDFDHVLKPQQKIEFIEQFNEKLLIKQTKEDLHIYDVRFAPLPTARTDCS